MTVKEIEAASKDEKAKRYPAEPETRQMAKQFVGEFKSEHGYQFAGDFETDLLHALEVYFDSLDLAAEHREAMAWRDES